MQRTNGEITYLNTVKYEPSEEMREAYEDLLNGVTTSKGKLNVEVKAMELRDNDQK